MSFFLLREKLARFSKGDDQNEFGATNRSFVAPGWLVAMGVNRLMLGFTNGDDS
ncbi:hypothetical protein [Dictyobacter arantiisoli]|uniref:Uncharacterized protein n=1 Tax=Dictyobacter arantiisoli TaxID=2014874 RepID=A0A5A5THZ0_9CHLR|nr:hypothetical protein [Dictyobacter arantiisoli]GCF10673.1 hypothetical protein KDI_42370 [Dictyobacter arantiisoli]